MWARTNEGHQDAQLVKECLQGSETAWNEFYGRLDGLIRIVVKRQFKALPHYSEDDMVQSVYLKLVTSLRSYDARQSSLRSFVGMVAKRACIEHLRKVTAASRHAWTNPVEHHDGDDEGAVMLTSTFQPPDGYLETAEQVNILSLALNRLKGSCRELIRLRFHMDLSHAKISEMLGKKEHAVNVQIIRCLAQLKAKYDEIAHAGRGI
ncbi:MAG: sigma-70 family RNA polymerase sigma factor [Deltaproteobacteria bacterium]|nr:sigma-70 family RNA polymerase sigma factor [Deltaproteobacteria bacterium]